MNNQDTNFNSWNQIKKATQKENFFVGFKERDIFYIKMGQNIGFEQNGKGKEFTRPVIVLKKLNKDMFIGIPTSTKQKKGTFFYTFQFLEKSKTRQRVVEDIAILAQIKVFSSKRLLNKIGVMNQKSFSEMKEKIKDLIFS